MISKKKQKKSVFFVIEDIHLDGRRLWVLLTSVLLLSFSLLAFEISLTRILSVVLSYHYVFVIVSLALLGLGLGGIFVYFKPPRPDRHGRFSSLDLFPGLFSLSISLSIILIALTAYLGNRQANILLYGFLFFIPFFLVGVFLAQIFRTFPALSSRIYGMDLIGAAAGSFGVVLILNSFGGINSSFLLALVAAIAALLITTMMPGKTLRVTNLSIISFAVAFILLVTNLLGSYLPGIPIERNPNKEIYGPLHSSTFQGEIIETRWSAFGRTDLVAFNNEPTWMAFFIDGTSGAPMYQFNGDLDNPGTKIESLKTEFPGYFPFLFLQEEERDNALVIGPGGGRDILLALMGGIDEITAVEVNRDLVDMVGEYAWYNGGIYTDLDNVTVIVDEGRNFLKRQKEKYDIIMLSLPVTRTSRSLEGFALTENFIFTRESIDDYLEHMTDEGSLIFVGHTPLEVARLLSLSLTGLQERGITEAEAMKHIYFVGWQRNSAMVMRKTPFEPARLESIHEALRASEFDSPESRALNEGVVTYSEMERAFQKSGVDISPVTDNSPFFYKFETGIPEPVWKYFLWPSIVILGLVIAVPFIFRRKRSSSRRVRSLDRTGFDKNTLRFVVLFFMLGLGFMLVEIPLIQRLILFLGQPILSLAVLLFSLLVGVGMGSMYSGRLATERLGKRMAIVCLSIVAMLLIYTFALPLIFNQLLGLELAIRLLVTVVLLVPLGFLMGFPFPSGLRLLKEIKMENHIPWMWGINGVSSVLGSAMAMVIAMSLGLTQVLLVATGCYLIVFWIFQTTQYKRTQPEKR